MNTWKSSVKMLQRAGFGLGLACLSPCAESQATAENLDLALDPATLETIRWKAVLVAGDSAQPVFDNAVRYLHDRLLAAGLAERDIRRLSASERVSGGDVETANLWNVAARIRGLKVETGEGCLIFLTSHGHQGRGLFLAPSKEHLTPSDLARALAGGCGGAPTVVIVSGCHTGDFARPPMALPNRIVFAAARADRKSFGCNTEFTYSIFDQCLLGSLEGSRTWREVHERTTGCVTTRENVRKDEHPSEPQVHFGAAVQEMTTPWRRRSLAEGPGVRFEAGPDRFSPAGVPLRAKALERHQKTLEAYARAPAPKALAMTPDGALGWRSMVRQERRTLADVQRMALHLCEWWGGICILYAVNDAVAAPLPSGLHPFHPPTLVRRGPVTPETTPFIRDDQRPRIAHYLSLPAPKALALGVTRPQLEFSTAATLEAAREAALEDCRKGSSECVIYAENDQVVLGYRGR